MSDQGRCASCGGEMRSMGITRFRTGGMTGGWSVFLSGWADIDENLLPLELSACTACRRVEMRVPGPAAPQGLPEPPP